MSVKFNCQESWKVVKILFDIAPCLLLTKAINFLDTYVNGILCPAGLRISLAKGPGNPISLLMGYAFIFSAGNISNIPRISERCFEGLSQSVSLPFGRITGILVAGSWWISELPGTVIIVKLLSTAKVKSLIDGFKAICKDKFMRHDNILIK